MTKKPSESHRLGVMLGLMGADRARQIFQTLRKEGMSQAKVARRIGIAPQYLSHIVAGWRPLSELLARRLAEEFNLNLKWIRTGEGDPQAVEVLNLPFLRVPVAGDPRSSPLWDGTLMEVAGRAAVAARQAKNPYVLEMASNDLAHNLQKGNLILVSQSDQEDKSLLVVRAIPAADLPRDNRAHMAVRGRGGRIVRMDTGEPFPGQVEIVGYGVGLIWRALDDEHA